MMIRMTSLVLAGLLAACGGVKVETASPDSDLNTSDSAVEDTKGIQATAETSATEYDFTLTDTDGKTHTLSSYLADGKTVVLEWFNPGCPVVKRYHKEYPAMKGYAAAALTDDDVVWLAINSGAPGNQGHGKQLNADARIDWGLTYPVLLDESGDVGRLFGAQTTPHMFVITPDGEIVYRGGIDESEGRGQPLPESLVNRALAELAAGTPITVPETKAFGCSVKYAH